MLLTASRLALFPGFPTMCTTGRNTKGKRNAERRVANTARPCRGHGARSCGARSPLGVPLRLLPEGPLVPKAQSGPALHGTANRGEDRAHLHGSLPAPNYPRTVRPHAPVMMPAGGCPMPPGSGLQIRPRAPHSPRPKECPRKNVPSKGEMHSFSSAGGVNSRNSGGRSHPFDLMEFFFRCLFDSRARKLWHCRHDLHFFS